MHRYFPAATSSSQYRRGAIMGLTVAEAFMLIAFVLLLLLLFWRHQVQDDVDLASQLSQEKRQALSEGAVPVPEERLKALEKRWRLLEDPELRDLAEAAEALKPDQLRKLKDLVQEPDVLSSDTALVPSGRLTELEDYEQWVEENKGEIDEALNLRRELDPDGEYSNEELLARIEDLMALASQLSQEKRQALSEGAVPVPEERLKALEKRWRLLEDPELRDLAEAAEALKPDQLRKLKDLVQEPDVLSSDTALVPSGRLTELEDYEQWVEENKGEIDEALNLRRELDPDGEYSNEELLARIEDLMALASQLSQEKRQALSEGAVPVPEERLKALEKRWRLLEDPELRDLAEAAEALKPDQLRKLKDLVQEPDVLSSDTALVPSGRLTELEDYEQWVEENKGEIDEALNLRRELDPDGEYSNEELLARIEDLMVREGTVDNRLAEDEAVRREFIANLKQRLGADVEKAGGKIEADGRVVFPETVVFEAGSAVIPLGFKTALDDICPRWLEEIRNWANQPEIDEIRIEGHSSPEWVSAQTKRDAWVANLGLSQHRAQSVLVHCLDHAAGTALGEWARGKLTAVGYSSSRPVRVDGKEDPDASRRVVLAYEFSRDALIADLGNAGRMEVGSNPIRPISGKAQVIDADTIKLGEDQIEIRLEGIYAPEVEQPCIAAEGSEWACGSEARDALRQRIAGQNVVCDRLRRGLMRLWGICKIEGEEAELNRWVVEEGWAFALIKSSKAYADSQADAREARRGIWSGEPPMPPWRWREGLSHAYDTP